MSRANVTGFGSSAITDPATPTIAQQAKVITPALLRNGDAWNVSGRSWVVRRGMESINILGIDPRCGRRSVHRQRHSRRFII